jgi:hypothetical protein
MKEVIPQEKIEQDLNPFFRWTFGMTMDEETIPTLEYGYC